MNRHVSHHGVFINFCGHPTSKYESKWLQTRSLPVKYYIKCLEHVTLAVSARHGQKHTSAMRRHEPAMLAMDTYLIEYWSAN